MGGVVEVCGGGVVSVTGVYIMELLLVTLGQSGQSFQWTGRRSQSAAR